MLDNYERSMVLNFCKALFTALHKKKYQKYLFEVFTQMIKVENEKNLISKANKKRIEMLQSSLQDAGVGHMAFNIIRQETNDELVIAALQFLHVMLIYDNTSFTNTIHNMLNDPKFCFKLLSFIRSSLKDFKDSVTKVGPVIKIKRYRSLKTMDYNENSLSKITLCKNLLYLIELLCEKSPEKFQNIFREQTSINEYAVSINLVSEITNILVSLSGNENIKGCNDTVEGKALNMVCMQCLSTLTALCEGLCPENQKEIGSSVKVYSFINWLIQDCAYHADVNSMNCIEILRKTIKFLNSLVEGETTRVIMKVLIQELDVKILLGFVCVVYEKFIFGKEKIIYRGYSKYDMWWLKMFESKEHPPDDEVLKIIQVSFSMFCMFLLIKEYLPNNEKLEEIYFVELSQEKVMKNQVVDLFSDNLKKRAYNFYLENISKVEINYKGKLIPVIFMKPFLTVHLSSKSRKYLLRNMTNFTYQAKIQEFLKRCDEYKTEMIYQQRLERYPFIANFASRWYFYRTIAFYLTCAINIMLLLTIKKVDELFAIEANPILACILYFLCACQIISATLSLLSYLFEYSPMIYLSPHINKSEFAIAKKRLEGTLLNREIKMMQKKGGKNSVLRGITQIFMDSDVFYVIIYFFISYLAIQNLMWYGLLILDTIKRSQVLKNVLRSITLNYKLLLLTLILGIIIIYIFSIFGFLFYTDTYNQSENKMYCDTLSVCFFTTLNKGVRAQGGIGTALAVPNDRYDRMLFDMAFFIIIIVVLLKVIFGIIIDTFAELRDMREEQFKNLEQTCFICGKNKFEFEVRRISWNKHINDEHNAHAYLAFIVYIMMKKSDMNGIEKYVKMQVDINEPMFFPKSSIGLAKYESIKLDEQKDYAKKFNSIKNRLEDLAYN
ncbi:hypothetical protein SteCoe_23623 [Stentor coeruleus]|uniref:Ion transport domain-containing protein n=1 Tax=Stentor coeruleus TaxID=5963 RepID=A0A1R2BJI9_9CILI|nr:hypothetical protein SteCoe_23623 [Stentor coeruleus]